MHLFKLLIKSIALKINLFLDSMDQVKFINYESRTKKLLEYWQLIKIIYLFRCK